MRRRRDLSDRQRFVRTVQAQRRARQAESATRRIYPERITMALDTRGLDGPGVDVACGGIEPMVDEWEDGTRVPTDEQLRLLADLTGFLPEFFYRPPGSPFVGFICGAGGCAFIDKRPPAPVTPIVKETLW